MLQLKRLYRLFVEFTSGEVGGVRVHVCQKADDTYMSVLLSWR